MTAQVTIREAQSGDAEAATDVLRRSIVELGTLDHRNDPERLGSWLANKQPDVFRSWVDDPNNKVFVAVRDGKVVGVGSIRRDGYIGLNYVAPEARYAGVSRSMLAHLENEARRSGLARVFLTSTATAQKFYQSVGYRLRPDEEISDGSSLPMEKLFERMDRDQQPR
jgi:N-acetylglutamate synthase-like GNAT family acetyltransferase